MNLYEVFLLAAFFVACGLFAVLVSDAIVSIASGRRPQEVWMPYVHVAATIVIFGLVFA